MKFIPVFLTACLLPAARALSFAPSRPNILWLTCEHISPYIGSYGCQEAHTPNLDKLAESGFEGDRTLSDESSNKAHWRNRKDGQRFFAVFNFTTTHESQLAAETIRKYVRIGQIPAKPRIEPKDTKLPTYHQDLPEIREDSTRLHDLSTRMDEQIGKKLRELEDAGEADNTIFFFFSDHGGMLSRSKRYIYNVGTQMPLILRVPQKWRHLAPARPGETSDRVVSFVDFAKSAISLVGVGIPDLMQGRGFLGKNMEPVPETIHFHRDHMRERSDCGRAVTDGRYYFIRHFMPHRPPGRDNRYGNSMQANWNAREKHFDQGRCDPIQSQFCLPKPVIEFFDPQDDPSHLKNLAAEPSHQARILAFSRDLDQWMIETRDSGLIPEAPVADLAAPDKPHKRFRSADVEPDHR